MKFLERPKTKQLLYYFIKIILLTGDKVKVSGRAIGDPQMEQGCFTCLRSLLRVEISWGIFFGVLCLLYTYSDLKYFNSLSLF